MGFGDETRGNYSVKSCLFVMALMLIGTILCGVSVYVVVNNKCASEARTWLPVYPGAEIVEEQFTFLRMFGIGQSRRILYTPDDAPDVRRWYLQYMNDTTRETGSGIGGGFANMSYEIRAADDGRGATIYQFHECSRELDLSGKGLDNED